MRFLRAKEAALAANVQTTSNWVRTAQDPRLNNDTIKHKLDASETPRSEVPRKRVKLSDLNYAGRFEA